MSTHDSGVTDLLRRASDDLAPDVDRIVRGGITRGRTRQRRARIGTTIASLAVIGVVGGLAVVVPRLGDPDSARGPEIATDGATATSTPGPGAQLRLKDMGADQLPAIAISLLSTGRTEVPNDVVVLRDGADDKLVQFRTDGMVTDLGVEAGGSPSLSECRANDAERLGGTCSELDDDAVILLWGPTLTDGVTCQGVNVQRSGFQVWATSCNAADAKDSPPLAPDPFFSLPELGEMAASEFWFE